MVKAWIPAVTAVAAILGGFYEFHMKDLLVGHGVIGRIRQPINNERCHKVSELQACESKLSPILRLRILYSLSEVILHQPSGLLYLACSSPLKRKLWLPGLDFLDANARLKEEDDYVAIYDHSTSTVSRLTLSGFEDPRGLFVHGFDVVPSSSNPDELFVYMINHRPPVSGDPLKVGSDSVVEIFKTSVGGRVLSHVTTVRDPVIKTPNDILGLPDGRSFYFSNDHGNKVGWVSASYPS